MLNKVRLTRSSFCEISLLHVRGIIYFDLTWKEEDLDNVYGVPRDVAQLASDINRTIKTELLFQDFLVHGK